MELIHQDHHGFFFCDNFDLSPSPELYKLLIKAFEKYKFILNIGQEVNIKTGEKKQYIILTNSTDDLRVEFPAQGVVVKRIKAEYKDFFGEFNEIIKILSNTFPLKKANRLSLVSTKIFNGTEQQYKKIYDHLFTYRAIHPFEWDNRIAEKKYILKSSEEINSISNIKRGEMIYQYINNGQPKSVIAFTVDTNTSPAITENRFTFENSIDAYNEIHNNNIELWKELDRYEHI